MSDKFDNRYGKHKIAEKNGVKIYLWVNESKTGKGKDRMNISIRCPSIWRQSVTHAYVRGHDIMYEK